jgi:hypothetical protein
MNGTRIFLSYHTSDHKVAECLAEGLGAHAPDLSVFFAPRVLRAGAFWIPAFTEAIEEADAFLRQIHRLQFPDPTADEALQRLLPALR